MDRFPIVAVACSAADLESVAEVLSSLPAECGAAFIIAQHTDSRRELLPPEALCKRTILPVMHVHDGVLPEQDHVYLIRPKTILTMTGGRIRVTPHASGLHHPGDILFTSLAEQCGDGAIGVVLSGGGSDGAIGVQAIKRNRGITFAQYPGSARFPSMPISAIETGCVDSVLLPNEITRALLTRLSRHAVPAIGIVPHVLVRDENAGPRRVDFAEARVMKDALSGLAALPAALRHGGSAPAGK